MKVTKLMKTLSPISRSRELRYRGLKDTSQLPSFRQRYVSGTRLDGAASAEHPLTLPSCMTSWSRRRTLTLRLSGQRRSSSVLRGGPLLVVPFDQLRRNWSQITKQSSGAMVRSSSEVDLCGRRCRGIAVVRIDVARA